MMCKSPYVPLQDGLLMRTSPLRTGHLSNTVLAIQVWHISHLLRVIKKLTAARLVGQ